MGSDAFRPQHAGSTGPIVSLEPPCRNGGALAHLRDMLDTRPGEAATAAYRGLRLSSAFQPIFSLRHCRTVGYEGLLRAHNPAGTPVEPGQVFPLAVALDEVVKLDRLARVLHTANFAHANRDDGWLFLNINPAVVINGKFHGAFFRELLDDYGIPPERVVVEVLECDSNESHALEQAIQYYRDLGCLVAIDDFGAGHSNIDRIVALRPDVVKIDRQLIARAEGDRLARRLLENLVQLLHAAGCLVVLEGIENEAQAIIARNSDADFVQGYYFARPAADPISVLDTRIFDKLTTLSEQSNLTDRERCRELLTPYRYAVTDLAMAYALGSPLHKAARGLCKLARVLRCYVLDEHGHQREETIYPPDRPTHRDQRFAPLAATDGADWSRRPYFLKAVGEPGRLHISAPYLSVVGAQLNLTLSIAIRRNEGTRVICCDLYWEDRH